MCPDEHLRYAAGGEKEMFRLNVGNSASVNVYSRLRAGALSVKTTVYFNF